MLFGRVEQLLRSRLADAKANSDLGDRKTFGVSQFSRRTCPHLGDRLAHRTQLHGDFRRAAEPVNRGKSAEVHEHTLEESLDSVVSTHANKVVDTFVQGSLYT